MVLPTYWDSSGIHELDNPAGTVNMVASHLTISPMGITWVGIKTFLELAPFSAGEQATVWQRESWR